MKYALVRRVLIYSIALLCFVSSIIGIEYAHRAHVAVLLNDAREEQALNFELARARVESIIFRDIYLSESLATYIATQPQSTAENWEPIAKLMYDKSRAMRNIGLAPNDVLSFMYPLEGNEQALGTNLRNIPAQAAALERARAERQMIVSGPVELVQGGTAIIARVPIFTLNENNRYWGSASVVLDIDTLLNAAGLTETQTNSEFAIRGRDGLGEAGDIFWGDATLFSESHPTKNINLPNGSWQLTYSSVTELPQNVSWMQHHLMRVTGYALLFAVSIAFFYILALLRVAKAHSSTDLLTGLYNRRFITTYVDTQLQRRGVAQNKLGILYLDLNGFKQVNDQLGHEAGDQVLVQVGQRIQSVISSSDLVARLGGDEFMVVLGRVRNLEDAGLVAERIREAIVSKAFFELENAPKVGTSVGIAIAPDDGQNFEVLAKKADTRMYENKRSRGISR